MRRRLSSGHGCAHRERSGDQGSSGEPGEPGTPVGRCVQPRRERREEGERAVEVVQPLRRTAVLGEEQESESHLRDEKRLRERGIDLPIELFRQGRDVHLVRR